MIHRASSAIVRAARWILKRVQDDESGWERRGSSSASVRGKRAKCPEVVESGPAAIERSGQLADIRQMPTSQHTIVNKQDGPIYISTEPWPECYELEPGDRLTLSYGLPQSGDALEVQFINERELVLWPTELDPEPVVLINDASAEGRSWKFKHQ
ncbi:hypothetical protein [Sphingomonas hylomeconis]|nr:hypothetical protein [Sphingomonas hylomeconis]